MKDHVDLPQKKQTIWNLKVVFQRTVKQTYEIACIATPKVQRRTTMMYAGSEQSQLNINGH